MGKKKDLQQFNDLERFSDAQLLVLGKAAAADVIHFQRLGRSPEEVTEMAQEAWEIKQELEDRKSRKRS